MGATNIGNQKIFMRYKHPATGSEFNKWMNKIMRAGLYEGGDVTIDSGNDVNIAPFVALIRVTTGEMVKVETSSVVNLTISEASPYIVINFDWVDNENNYADFEAKDLGGLYNNDVILAKGEYVGGVLTSISTDVTTWGLLYSTGNVTATNDLIAQNDLSIANNANIQGDASINGKLTVNSNPTLDTHVGNKGYNDSQYINKSLGETLGFMNYIKNSEFETWYSEGHFNAEPKNWNFNFSTTGDDPILIRDGDGSVLLTANALTTSMSFYQNIFDDIEYQRLKGKKVQAIIKLKTTSPTTYIKIDDGIDSVIATTGEIIGTPTEFKITHTINSSATKLDLIIADDSASSAIINIYSARMNEGELASPYQKNIHDYIQVIEQYGKNPILRNGIINADMSIKQRSASWTNISSSQYTLDRWYYSVANQDELLCNITQVEDTPSSSNSKYSLKLEVATPETTLDTDESMLIGQKIEGINFDKFKNKNAILSFWVKSSITGIYSIQFTNSAGDRTFISEYVIESSNTWEFKTIVINISLGTALGTWLYGEGEAGLSIFWCLGVGTTYQSSNINQWESVTAYGSANQISNFVTTSGATFQLSDVQFNEGDILLPFYEKTFNQNLEECKRYYEKSYKYTEYAGTISSTNIYSGNPSGMIDDTRISIADERFKVIKSKIPVVHLYSPSTGIIDKVETYSSEADISVSSIITPSKENIGFYIQLGATTSGEVCTFHYIADAEL